MTIKIRGSLLDVLGTNECPVVVIAHTLELEKQYDDLFALAEAACEEGQAGDLAHVKLRLFLTEQKRRFTTEEDTT